MTDPFWKDLARNAGLQRNFREEKRSRIVGSLDWTEWTQEEREVYAAAFLFPVPAEPLIDGMPINGVEMNLARYARTAVICDCDGNVWRVVEHGRPVRM